MGNPLQILWELSLGCWLAEYMAKYRSISLMGLYSPTSWLEWGSNSIALLPKGDSLGRGGTLSGCYLVRYFFWLGRAIAKWQQPFIGVLNRVFFYTHLCSKTMSPGGLTCPPLAVPS